ncbi:cytochrome c oxidase cbb3-type subunit 4 [Paucimonas lemoignei]|uniref:Cytochrome c oxidase cbb3-type subunit 4 n=1 Tax=Paucimonas lemoignei TaxID=29443 RepID=A0A4R3I3L0_PAULE|nr:CcoQ/FixQ family Cbb3-type cytochrome c oxidase assembly chaperone [Paucimonas lemoignei]TCS39421.1 cytochrome c oxidase cbb3-type subunit 4 [Paucimonas lemoignei]
MSLENFFIDTRSVITTVSFITFVGIIVWTYLLHRASDFNEAAMLPFADEQADSQVDSKTSSTENQHG